MNCSNCPYNNGGSTNKPIITHPYGNQFGISIPMTSVIATVSNGNEVREGRNFPINTVKLALVRGKHEYVYNVRIATNLISFNDVGVLPVGTYDLVISYRGTDSKNYRYRQEDFLRIVDGAADGGEYGNGECDVIAYYPKVNGNISAIDITDTDVVINEGRGFTGDNTPNDGYADISADYGTSKVEVGDNDVTLTI